MKNVAQQLEMKAKVLECIRICGGMTGRFMRLMCPDEEVLQDIMESERLYKVPIRSKGENGEIKKITVYEDHHYKRKRRVQQISEQETKYLSYKNDLYLKYLDTATVWMDQDDISSLAKKRNVNESMRPHLIFYVDDKRCGIIIRFEQNELDQDEKTQIAGAFDLNKLIEVVVPQ